MDAGATLRGGDKTLDLPLVKATEGNDGYDVSKLLKETGNVTLDTGFVNTASCTQRHHLHRRRRGHPALPRLPDRAAGREVDASSRSSYLLIYGELPTADRARRLRPAASAGTRCCTRTSSRSSTASRATRTRCRCCPRAVTALSTFYQDSLDPFDQEQVEISTVRLLAKLPTIAAYAYKKSVGQPFLYPDNSLR